MAQTIPGVGNENECRLSIPVRIVEYLTAQRDGKQTADGDLTPTPTQHFASNVASQLEQEVPLAFAARCLTRPAPSDARADGGAQGL